MANSYDLEAFELAMTLIPLYDGTNMSVHEYLFQCEHALTIIDLKFEASLVKIMKSKLQGEAHEAIQYKTFKNFNEFKYSIISLFKTPESALQTLNKLTNVFQNNNETVIAYANRLRALEREILNTYFVEKSFNDTTRNFIKQSALDAFIRGLKPEIEVRMQRCYSDIAESMMDAIQIEKFGHLNYRNIKNSQIKDQHESKPDSDLSSKLKINIKTEKCELQNFENDSTLILTNNTNLETYKTDSDPKSKETNESEMKSDIANDYTSRVLTSLNPSSILDTDSKSYISEDMLPSLMHSNFNSDSESKPKSCIVNNKINNFLMSAMKFYKGLISEISSVFLNENVYNDLTDILTTKRKIEFSSNNSYNKDSLYMRMKIQFFDFNNQILDEQLQLLHDVARINQGQATSSHLNPVLKIIPI